MHVEKENKDDITYMHADPKLKKAININLSVKIKFKLHLYLSYNKMFKTRSHLPIFGRYFSKIFSLIIIFWFLSEQIIIFTNKKIKYNEQIIMSNEQSITYREYMII